MASLVADHGRPDVARQRLRERRGDGLAEREVSGVQRHTDLAVGAHAIELRNVGGRRDAARGRDASSTRGAYHRLHSRAVEPSHSSFSLDLREQEATDDRRERANALKYGDAGLLAPTFHHDLAAFRVHSRDDTLTRQRAAKLRCRGRPDHDLDRTSVEPAARAVEIADASPDAARRAPDE